MLILYQAFANIGKLRLRGDVIKENALTVLMRFTPPEDLKRKVLEQTGILLTPTKIVKRHKIKHMVRRTM
ncbi:MAG: hypothetical protein ACFFCW_38495 [Candidatus Hodarchaeota archaeon]